MRLMPITTEDEDLTVRLECDPEIMCYIGGPRLEADIRPAHKHRLDLMEKGEAKKYTIFRLNPLLPALPPTQSLKKSV